MKVISLDCETNGLGGTAFAVAAILTDDGGVEVDRLVMRCPILGTVDPWVAQHVLPAIADLKVTHAGYGQLLAEWRYWYAPLHGHATVIGHVVLPVEARFLLDAHGEAPLTLPYPLIDVAGLLDAYGWDPKSVDDYLRAQRIGLPEGSPHDPLYDVRATEKAYRRLKAGAQ